MRQLNRHFAKDHNKNSVGNNHLARTKTMLFDMKKSHQGMFAKYGCI